MSDGDALLAAILAHPEEDTPRLVYADWLDERGGEYERAHADFIRRAVAHCQATGHRDPADLSHSYTVTPDWWWYEMMGRWPGRLPAEWHWIGGFVAGITTEAAAWLSHGDSAVKLHPIQRVTITDMSGWDARVAQFDSHGPGNVFFCSRWPGVAFALPPARTG